MSIGLWIAEQYRHMLTAIRRRVYAKIQEAKEIGPE
jgi:hypothetical protein